MALSVHATAHPPSPHHNNPPRPSSRSERLLRDTLLRNDSHTVAGSSSSVAATTPSPKIHRRAHSHIPTTSQRMPTSTHRPPQSSSAYRQQHHHNDSSDEDEDDGVYAHGALLFRTALTPTSPNPRLVRASSSRVYGGDSEYQQSKHHQQQQQQQQRQERQQQHPQQQRSPSPSPRPTSRSPRTERDDPLTPHEHVLRARLERVLAAGGAEVRIGGGSSKHEMHSKNELEEWHWPLSNKSSPTKSRSPVRSASGSAGVDDSRGHGRARSRTEPASRKEDQQHRDGSGETALLTPPPTPPHASHSSQSSHTTYSPKKQELAQVEESVYVQGYANRAGHAVNPNAPTYLHLGSGAGRYPSTPRKNGHDHTASLPSTPSHYQQAHSGYTPLPPTTPSHSQHEQLHPHTPFNARTASAQCRAMEGYVSFAAVEGLGVPPDDGLDVEDRGRDQNGESRGLKGALMGYFSRIGA